VNPEDEDVKVPEKEIQKAYSIFHGKHELIDGRSYLSPPLHYGRMLHTYTGHSKGVTSLQFFPKTGHFLMTSSFDGRLKLWDVLTHKWCVRTYIGHEENVRSFDFSPNDGHKFISAGLDKVIQEWDTETGKVIHSYNNKRMPFCAKIHPTFNNSFIVGNDDARIYQYDMRDGWMVLKYEAEHMNSVNTLTFINEGRNFVSTADEKKICYWEFGIPVMIKHINEPDMSPISATATHPNGKYFAG
jgi:pre-mRNA-processing factor 17